MRWAFTKASANSPTSEPSLWRMRKVPLLAMLRQQPKTWGEGDATHRMLLPQHQAALVLADEAVDEALDVHGPHDVVVAIVVR